MLDKPDHAPLAAINDPVFLANDLKLFLKREDLLHPTVSGNKWRKLRYNLLQAKDENYDTVISFGGAFSNHIHALAAGAKLYGLNAVGVIRGEKHIPLNSTLAFAEENGMQLHYISREAYRLKHTANFIDDLAVKYGRCYVIPEGGTNLLAVKGCAEIVEDIPVPFDYICTSCGTGGTLAGLIAGCAGKGKLLGFSALKGGAFLHKEVEALVKGYSGRKYTNWKIQDDYHFGGYAKIKPELVVFIKAFAIKYGIQLDPIYTGKMMFGLFELAKMGYFAPGTTIVALHTGGLQGLAGIKARKPDVGL